MTVPLMLQRSALLAACCATWQGVLSQLTLLGLVAFAVLETFWPKRSVALPTLSQPESPAVPTLDQLTAFRTDQLELRQRLCALEEAVGCQPV